MDIDAGKAAPADYLNASVRNVDSKLKEETANNTLHTTLLVCGFASIAASLGLQFSGKKQEALFVGQWPTAFFILAIGARQLR